MIAVLLAFTLCQQVLKLNQRLSQAVIAGTELPKRSQKWKVQGTGWVGGHWNDDGLGQERHC